MPDAFASRVAAKPVVHRLLARRRTLGAHTLRDERRCGFRLLDANGRRARLDGHSTTTVSSHELVRAHVVHGRPSTVTPWDSRARRRRRRSRRARRRVRAMRRAARDSASSAASCIAATRQSTRRARCARARQLASQKRRSARPAITRAHDSHRRMADDRSRSPNDACDVFRDGCPLRGMAVRARGRPATRHRAERVARVESRVTMPRDERRGCCDPSRA